MFLTESRTTTTTTTGKALQKGRGGRKAGTTAIAIGSDSGERCKLGSFRMVRNGRME